ncbi:MAG: 4Fe-4S binding protein [Chloroflexi bacterium]|nr:4Fe-4S binding protein [Chloroflexota bacterium]
MTPPIRHLPPRPSTRAFIAEARRTPGYTFFDWLHGYVYGRWPYLYIGISTGEHPLARRARPVIAAINRLITARERSAPPAPLPMREGENAFPSPRRACPELVEGGGAGGEVAFADTYHGKVITLSSATRLVSVGQEVDLRNLEHVIPYALARDIVLKHPDHIVALECPCRAARASPCTPLDVCLIVGEPFASFAAEHLGRRSRWITSGEAVEILRAEHARGHVQHAFFKDAMLGRFYAVCNCCSCCCGAMQAQRSGVPMLAASGYVSRIAAERCIGCGACAEHCQFGAISVNGHACVDQTACMGCGVCVDTCEQGALALVRDDSKAAPLELDALMAAAMMG